MADKYEKVAKLGEGSFGVVWKVKHRQTGQPFAVKKIRMQSRDHGVSLAAIDEINALQVRSWCSVFSPPDPCDACACLLPARVLASRHCVHMRANAQLAAASASTRLCHEDKARRMCKKCVPRVHVRVRVCVCFTPTRSCTHSGAVRPPARARGDVA